MRIAICLTLCFVFTASAFAQFTIDQIMSAPYTANLTAAKNAPRIAWTFNIKGERNIWVADAPDYKARQVTHYKGDEGQELSSVRLTPDGKTVVYVRGGETNEGGRSADPAQTGAEIKQQVWAVDVDSNGEPRLLGDMGCHYEGCEDVQISPDGKTALWMTKKTLWTAPIYSEVGKKIEAKQLHPLQGSSDDAKWSPDGKQIVFTLSRGGNDHRHIVVFDVATSAVKYIAPSTDRSLFPRWSPDGKHIAFARVGGRENRLPIIPRRPQPWSIWIGDPQTGTAQKIWESGQQMNDSLPHFAETSFIFAKDRIVFNSEQDGWSHLYSVPTVGEGSAAKLAVAKPTPLTPGDFDVEDVTLSANGDSVIYTSNQFTTDKLDQDRRHIWRVSIAGSKPEQITKGESMEWKPTVSSQTICYIGSTAKRPGMPQCADKLIGQELIPADFLAAQLVVPKQVIFKSDDGLTIHGQLFEPRGQKKSSSGKSPAIIYTHGGPIRQMMLGYHYSYYYNNAYAANQYLASLGYTVLSVNYRLGIMYGRAFRQAENSSWRGGYEYKDVVAGAKYLQSLPTVDKDRIGLWGGSYGGYLTAMGLAHNSDIFKAGVDFHGVHDWSVLLAEDEDDAKYAPDYKEAIKLAFASSPDSSVSTWKSPVLLIHGDDDRNVPFNQTTDLAERLKKQGVSFEEIIYPDEIHDFLLWKSWVNSYRAMGEYFDKHVKQ
jgi:dipeptidyl aminopeptidase/acylaminoacyl peptidase